MSNCTQEVRGIAHIILEKGETLVIDSDCSGNITSKFIADTITSALNNNVAAVKIGTTTVDVSKVWLVQDIDTKEQFIINQENKVPSINIKDVSSNDLFANLFESIQNIEQKDENEWANELLEELYDRYYRAKYQKNN